MTKSQIITLAASLILFLVLLLGFDTIPPKMKSLEKSRVLNVESTSVTNLIKDAQTKLTPQQTTIIEAINLDLSKAGTDTIKRVSILKSLSGTWYEMGFPSIAGNYAEEIATIAKTAESWSIAGTTYALCVKSTEDVKIKEFCSKRAVKAFEKTISLDPENIDARINLAICYVDNPLQESPMQGIMMLRDLNTKYPRNVSILNQLAKLALQTNQIDKALERLEAAILIEPDNNNTICMLAAAYESAGNKAKAEEYQKKCIN
jgi:tetratricopeptide (TPR) repeat protein